MVHCISHYNKPNYNNKQQMVSTSRKKNKGKDRKAKKEADRVEAERVRARNVWFKWVTGHKDLVGKTITCKHVMGENILSMSDDHPVVRFLHGYTF